MPSSEPDDDAEDVLWPADGCDAEELVDDELPDAELEMEGLEVEGLDADEVDAEELDVEDVGGDEVVDDCDELVVGEVLLWDELFALLAEVFCNEWKLYKVGNIDTDVMTISPWR